MSLWLACLKRYAVTRSTWHAYSFLRQADALAELPSVGSVLHAKGPPPSFFESGQVLQSNSLLAYQVAAAHVPGSGSRKDVHLSARVWSEFRGPKTSHDAALLEATMGATVVVATYAPQALTASDLSGNAP